MSCALAVDLRVTSPLPEGPDTTAFDTLLEALGGVPDPVPDP